MKSILSNKWIENTGLSTIQTSAGEVSGSLGKRNWIIFPILAAVLVDRSVVIESESLLAFSMSLIVYQVNQRLSRACHQEIGGLLLFATCCVGH